MCLDCRFSEVMMWLYDDSISTDLPDSGQGVLSLVPESTQPLAHPRASSCSEADPSLPLGPRDSQTSVFLSTRTCDSRARRAEGIFEMGQKAGL